MSRKSANHLRTALQKRIQCDTTQAVIDALTPSCVRKLIFRFDNFESMRAAVDSFVAIMRFIEAPYAGEIFNIVSRLDWERIKIAFEKEERKNEYIPSIKTDPKIENDPGIDL